MSNEITNEKLFEFMINMYSDLSSKIDGIENEVKNINIKIDHEIMPKMDALFNGYKQNSDKLDRIEEEVSKQEEIILRKIK